ncbi:MAG: 4Fe-4S binding protein [Candidatus Nanoarchaeia archaeon]|nr:4Fe-4S binding protein [Candidatus Nanoarchaeia archaeon]
MPPKIDKKKCNNCGTCIDICPVSVFGKKGEEVIVLNPQDCIECNACVVSCPQKAIKLKEVKSSK